MALSVLTGVEKLMSRQRMNAHENVKMTSACRKRFMSLRHDTTSFPVITDPAARPQAFKF